jgi:hypothetical protein
MGFLSEFRDPTKWYSKLFIAALALFFFTILATAAISGYLLYRMISPAQSHSDIDLRTFPGHPESLSYTVAGEGPRDGWFFPGLKSAPTVVLCPAYQSSRGELLTLASALQDHQYNVLVFDFSAQGSSGGRTTLGFREVRELRAVAMLIPIASDCGESTSALTRRFPKRPETGAFALSRWNRPTTVRNRWSGCLSTVLGLVRFRSSDL